MSTAIDYRTLRVRRQGGVTFVRIERPEADNAINAALLEEMADVLDRCDAATHVIVLEGQADAFCVGADFAEIRAAHAGAPSEAARAAGDPGPLFDLWHRLATGPRIVISHVRGKVNAGGVGFVAASDIVLADDTATFSLSELLFGLMPACVLPFLIRRIGWQRAHYMTLSTQPLDAARALAWGLVDAHDANGEALLRRHLARLRRLDGVAVARYKRYANALTGRFDSDRSLALAANREVFSDPTNLERIVRFVESGIFPWEAS
ncbi:enoyl-CoA hydratase/isomerase [Burkholderia gladioli]|uniref:enoyl-CoA hydratase/isomerase n=1 Tax=Burkholderia gladioli TaxID=28095 RepID=UPI00163F22A7|nr:enoyl-CoA hydratase/isomerase [Burkholderia gladioli]MBJ9679655.1 enoyl-CoA hydratase/isomerase [Burkholderia gladioli]MDN7462002.1 enoyl-CoA hydratase/isomerase [Burkholderia gladioli]MDN7717682.1 enoyl-CoA hydratase/isomerase [Burkholderia gladioli]